MQDVTHPQVARLLVAEAPPLDGLPEALAAGEAETRKEALSSRARELSLPRLPAALEHANEPADGAPGFLPLEGDQPLLEALGDPRASSIVGLWPPPETLNGSAAKLGRPLLNTVTAATCEMAILCDTVDVGSPMKYCPNPPRTTVRLAGSA